MGNLVVIPAKSPAQGSGLQEKHQTGPLQLELPPMMMTVACLRQDGQPVSGRVNASAWPLLARTATEAHHQRHRDSDRGASRAPGESRLKGLQKQQDWCKALPPASLFPDAFFKSKV